MGYSPWGYKESDATELTCRAANSIVAPFLSFLSSFFLLSSLLSSYYWLIPLQPCLCSKVIHSWNVQVN